MSLSPDEIEARLALVRRRVRDVPDFPKPGILFRDITPVLADRAALAAAIDLHVDKLTDLRHGIDKVVGIESRGFLFGMAVAARLDAGFVVVRKPGKLPAQVIEASYALEYGTDRLQIHADAIAPGERILVIDDLLATGGTAAAACDLARRCGGEVVGALFLIELTALGGRSKLPGVRVDAVLAY
ncbi:MAG: adenine phosphoribosyltransferase [Nannocystaceae bacterium]|nr:adenine phosphoribosyltransferase [Nannocystaceae bacterium]